MLFAYLLTLAPALEIRVLEGNRWRAYGDMSTMITAGEWAGYAKATQTINPRYSRTAIVATAGEDPRGYRETEDKFAGA